MHDNTIDRSDRAAFLRNIAVHRFHALPRLVYADWLDEHGPDQPADAKRAEMIRLAHDLVAVPEHHKPTDWCDCDRCRMMRRLTVLKDEGINNYPDPEPSRRLICKKAMTVGGFPVGAVAEAYRMPISDNGVGLEVARYFSAWPVADVMVTFTESAVRWYLHVTTAFDEKTNRAFVHANLTPYLREDDYAFDGRHWVSQDQWAVSKRRVAPSLQKLPDAVRKAVKKLACEKWTGRDTYQSRAGAGR